MLVSPFSFDRTVAIRQWRRMFRGDAGELVRRGRPRRTVNPLRVLARGAYHRQGALQYDAIEYTERGFRCVSRSQIDEIRDLARGGGAPARTTPTEERRLWRRRLHEDATVHWQQSQLLATTCLRSFVVRGPHTRAHRDRAPANVHCASETENPAKSLQAHPRGTRSCPRHF